VEHALYVGEGNWMRSGYKVLPGCWVARRRADGDITWEQPKTAAH
jgi:hypothetical protein